MLFSIRKLTKLQLIALSLVSLFGLTIFAMTIQKLTFHSFSVRQKTPVVSANLVASGQKEVKKSIEVIVVTLNPDGFFPKEVIVPKKTISFVNQ